MNGDIPIIQKVYDFYKEFNLVLTIMPKQDRHVVGERIQNVCLELLSGLVSASHAEKLRKREFLMVATTELDLLKMLVRLSEDIKAIPTKKYLTLSGKLQETGRMLGGWIKSLN